MENDSVKIPERKHHEIIPYFTNHRSRDVIFLTFEFLMAYNADSVFDRRTTSVHFLYSVRVTSKRSCYPGTTLYSVITLRAVENVWLRSANTSVLFPPPLFQVVHGARINNALTERLTLNSVIRKGSATRTKKSTR